MEFLQDATYIKCERCDTAYPREVATINVLMIPFRQLLHGDTPNKTQSKIFFAVHFALQYDESLFRKYADLYQTEDLTKLANSITLSFVDSGISCGAFVAWRLYCGVCNFSIPISFDTLRYPNEEFNITKLP